jgi:predicted CopG family antitoxin
MVGKEMMKMKRAEFEKKSFDEVIEQLCEEGHCITTFDTLKEFIKENVDNDNFNVASHLCNAIYNEPNPNNSKWYDYDYSMGTLEKPTCISSKEDIIHLLED